MASLQGTFRARILRRVRPRPLAAILLLLAGRAVADEMPLPGGIPDIAGPRMLGLSAGIGAAAGNDGLYLNPGAIAARKRYAIEGGMLVDRRGGTTADRFIGGSAVDSQSSPVTAGASYLRAQKGLFTGNVIHVALAGPIAPGFFLGVGGKWLKVEGPKSTSAATVDAGILWQVAELVSIGGTGYNLVDVGNDAIAPMGAGAGIAIGSDRSFQVTGDWRTDFDRGGKTTNRYAAGAELLIRSLIPIRAGWMRDETLDTSWWSAGVGIVTREGIALDVGYRQSIETPDARTIAATLKLFLFQ
jgi:hypothetical protein